MNEFPIFSVTGDVEIVIRAADQERRYLLHRLILAQCSGFFEAGMNEGWSRMQASRGEADPDDTRGSEELSAIDEDANEQSGPSSSRRAGPLATTTTTTKTRWRYELDWENREEDAVPILAQNVSIICPFLSRNLYSFNVDYLFFF